MKKIVFLLSMFGFCLGFIIFMLIRSEFNFTTSNPYFISIFAFGFLAIAFLLYSIFSLKAAKTNKKI